MKKLLFVSIFMMMLFSISQAEMNSENISNTSTNEISSVEVFKPAYFSPLKWHMGILMSSSNTRNASYGVIDDKEIFKDLWFNFQGNIILNSNTDNSAILENKPWTLAIERIGIGLKKYFTNLKIINNSDIYMVGNINYLISINALAGLPKALSDIRIGYGGFSVNGGIGIEFKNTPNVNAFVEEFKDTPNINTFIELQYQKSKLNESLVGSFPKEGFEFNIGIRFRMK